MACGTATAGSPGTGAQTSAKPEPRSEPASVPAVPARLVARAEALIVKAKTKANWAKKVGVVSDNDVADAIDVISALESRRQAAGAAKLLAELQCYREADTIRSNVFRTCTLADKRTLQRLWNEALTNGTTFAQEEYVHSAYYDKRFSYPSLTQWLELALVIEVFIGQLKTGYKLNKAEGQLLVESLGKEGVDLAMAHARTRAGRG